MSYHQTHLLYNQNVRHEQVVPAAVAVSDYGVAARSPFVAKNRHRLWRQKIQLWCVRKIEKLLGVTLYAKDTLGSFRTLSPETRALLTWLADQAYITSWQANLLTPGYPHVAMLFLKPGPTITPSGRKFQMGGATGNGSGDTLEAAARPAIGEFIERLATSTWWWERDDVVVGSYKELASVYPVIDPVQLCTYSHDQTQDTSNKLSEITPQAKMSWVSAERFGTKETQYVPLAAGYCFYNADNPQAPIFSEMTSNGAASQTTYEKAAYGAVCELIERDVFIRSWYHQKKGTVIEMDSILEMFPDFRSVYENFIAKGVTISFVDITEAGSVPTIASVIQNTDDLSSAVLVSATTDLSPQAALKKSLLEVRRFSHSWTNKDTPKKIAYTKAYFAGEKSITCYDDRHIVWSSEQMYHEMDWYIAGPKMSCQDFYNTHAHLLQNTTVTITEYTAVLKDILRKKQFDVYIMKAPHPAAAYAGLEVVRAISPQLIPVFFNENIPPLGMRRFTHDDDGATVDLYPVPHPFL